MKEVFDNLILVGEYGSWMKVQVAFYDFVFEEATKLCPKHWNQEALAKFAEGENFYESSIEIIEKKWPSFEVAWSDFVRERTEKD